MNDVLNELLECSVCLEHMDTSSKVLPCQHTFHRQCLENIISTKGELKCPECRTIVTARPEDLPPNILLMRLLESVRNVSPSCSGSSSTAISPTFAMSHHGPRTSATVTVTKPLSSEPCAKALYNYEAKEPGDLTFKKGDVICLRKRVDDNWYHGEFNNQQGFFPASYVQVITPLPDHTPRCKALYAFEIDDNDTDCLTFHKDEVLTVIRRVDNNWLEGKLGDKIGIFPTAFVELNDAAKHLINRPSVSSQGDSTPHTVVCPVVSPAQTGPGPTTNGAPSSTEQIAQHKKRHSLSTLSNNHYSPPVQQRHSVDISSNLHLSIAPPISTAPPIPLHRKQPLTLPTAAVTTISVTTATNSALSNTQAISTSVSHNIYVALYNYKPQKEDEVELKKAEYYSVTEKCQDGWCKGTCYRTGKTGVFPGNYVQHVKISQSVSKPSQMLPTNANVMNVRAVGPASLGPGSLMTPLEYKVRPGVTSPPLRTVGPGPALPGKPAGHISTQSMTVAQAQQARDQALTSNVSGALMANGSSPNQSHGIPESQSHSPKGANRIKQSTPDTNDIPQRSIQHRPLPQLPTAQQQHATSVTSVVPSNVTIKSAIGLPPDASQSMSAAAKDLKRREKDKVGFMKRLAAGKGVKKPVRPTPPSAQEVSGELAGVPGTASLPVQDGATNTSSQHKKTGSLDLSATSQQSGPILKPGKPKSTVRERFKCVVPYPPQSEYEIELREGDIIYVHKKREDGWYKGTLARTGKTGLFPGSFVDSC